MEQKIEHKNRDPRREEKKHEEKVVRILSKDIEGGMKVYVGLTKIKGISWSVSNAICKKLSIDKNRIVGSLTPEEIKKISDYIKAPNFPLHLYNRRKDFEDGTDKYLTGTDLELRTEFDIKRLKKIKSYRGLRHASGQPVRGQRTKGHFRSNRKKGGGIKVKKKAQESSNEKKA